MPPNPNVNNNTHTHKKKRKNAGVDLHVIPYQTILKMQFCVLVCVFSYAPSVRHDGGGRGQTCVCPPTSPLFFFFLPFPCPTSTPLFSLPLFSFLEHKQLHTATHARAFRKVL